MSYIIYLCCMWYLCFREVPKRTNDARCTKWPKLSSDHNFDQSTSHQVKITGKIILYLSDKNGGDDQGGEQEQVVRVCRQLLIWCKGWKKERVFVEYWYKIWQSKDEKMTREIWFEGIWQSKMKKSIFTARAVGVRAGSVLIWRTASITLWTQTNINHTLWTQIAITHKQTSIDHTLEHK